ncbi:RE1-silencing transcription factor [Salarias fasciatus]|uniref:C2H2-type domain-containing protein n=1 Tax=Salarias fasciatus TaxID=181472 RepID=A0A672GFJ6_SALFA|nr:RE1-silencing transcription factor [Salarias fasciatus]
MSTQAVYAVEMFPVGVPVMEDLSRNTLPAPQLVMLANVAAVTAAEGSGDGGSAADEKEMMELKTVGCSYSDSEDEGIIRYSYDNQNHLEVCIVEYPDSPAPNAMPVEEDEGDKAEDLSQPQTPAPPAADETPQQGPKRKEAPAVTPDSAKKKKPFHCKPCHFQAQNEQQFVEHLSSHSVSKMMVVNKVEGRSKTRTKEADAAPAATSEQAENGGEANGGDSKGLIRCERCGYNTNRYDHYIAHLKHHSKEGDDHRVFKCTLCPYTTVSQYHWRKHLRNHFPSKLHTCSQCSYFSDRKSNYIQHIRTHTGVRPFQCLFCDYSSSQKTHLTRHMRTHSGERPFKCESCSYLAANQHEVTRHARQVHNGPKPLSCPYCEYKTADRSNFKKHVELHIHPRQFLCPLCKYAASKKCNLQYHIKSRHSGCNVSVDISKVKLKKKPTADGAEESPEAKKAETSYSVEDDFDVDDADEDSSPINLSIGKSSQATQTVQSRSLVKPAINPEKEKVVKVKEKPEPERKVAKRQKKVEKVPVSPADSTAVKETQAAVENSDKVKRRIKKVSAEKATVQDQQEGSLVLADQTETENYNQQRSEEARSGKQKTKKEHQKVNQKENKNLNKPQKSGSKKSDKNTEHAEDAVKPDGPDKTPKEQRFKVKAEKRKAGEALDLSKKSGTPTKTRKLKAKPAPEDTVKTELNTAVRKSTGAGSGNQKKPRTKKSASPLQTVDAALDKAISPSTEAPESYSAETCSDKTGAGPKMAETHSNPTGTRSNAAGSGPGKAAASPAVSNAETKEIPPTGFQKSGKKRSQEEEVSSSSSSGELTPPVPVFLKPTSPPPLVIRNKPAVHEDDEGIHSSHEGGSDISDSASEGSDDSGLHSNDASSGKMPNDPETPTDEIPTPTELKSHMCIFCDRTFPLEVEYRRHLNRHLVNVYYMDATKASE